MQIMQNNKPAIYLKYSLFPWSHFDNYKIIKVGEHILFCENGAPLHAFIINSSRNSF